MRDVRALEQAFLETVCGGMRWQGLRPSENVEDRRGLSRRERMRVKSPPAPPLPPLVRHPNDLPHQLGLDDIDAWVRSFRRHRR